MRLNQRRLFISGTDTDCGKTLFTTALISALQQAGHRVMGLKPVAAGCERIDGSWINEDARLIIDTLSDKYPYSLINPIALKPAIAPHIAAHQQQIELSVAAIQQQCQLPDFNHDYIIIEGAGGWLVPLNSQQTFADYVVAESLEVIMVVGMKLGCINHALLTEQSIKSRGLKLVGWVANQIDPQMQNYTENLATLTAQLDCPLIAEIPFIKDDNPIQQASSCVKLNLF